MSAAPPTALGSGRRKGIVRRFAREFDSLGELLRAELAYRPRRLYLALRMATIGALGAGLMAALHVPTILGPVFMWVLVGTPAAMLAPATAVTYVAILAVAICLSVPLAGILSEAPWLMLPFIGALMALATYVSTVRNLGGLGVLIRIVIVDIFYSAVLDPGGFGWSASAIFGGCVVAYLLITSFDTVLWPDPAEAILIESLGNSLRRSAERIRTANRKYFEPVRDTRPVALVSDLPARLEMLNRATAEGISMQRRAVMLAAITREARLHIEIDRMMEDAMQPVPRALRAEFRTEFERVIDAIMRALGELAESVEQRMRNANLAPPPAAEALVRPAIAALEARLIAERPGYIKRTSADEVANLAGYATSLVAIASLVQHPLDAPGASSIGPTAQAPHRPLLEIQPEAARYCFKVAVCILIGFVIGLFSQRLDLFVILVTIIVTALPTYGASLRKMILRLLGTALGGLIALTAIVVVTPNFATLPVYILVCFIVLYISAYAGLGSGRTSYAGSQIGVMFLFIFAGLRPSEAIYTPLWRIWGVLLGVAVVTVVAASIWREYAHESMAPRLRKILRATLDLMPAGRADLTRIMATSIEITSTLYQLLTVADDAKLEGSASRIDPDEVVNAAGTLRRIANRFVSISRERITDPTPALAPETEQARAATAAIMRSRLTDWIEHIEGPHCHFRAAALRVAASHDPEELRQAFGIFAQRVGANGFAETGGWTFDQRRALLAEIESWRRLTDLFADLDHQFSHIPVVQKA